MLKRLILIVSLLISGCAMNPATVDLSRVKTRTSPDPVYNFGDSSAALAVKRDYKFMDCPLKDAVSDIALDYGVFVSYSSELSDKNITGVYKDIDLQSLLSALSLQVDSKLSFDGSIYYIGNNDVTKKYFLVGRCCVSQEDLDKVINSMFKTGDELRAVALGNKFLLYDTIDNLKSFSKLLRDYDDLRIKSYIAEVFFIRCDSQDLIDIQAKMDATGIDILKQSWSMKDLFNCYVDGDLRRNRNNLIQRPILYLSEDKEGVLEIGTDLTLEKKAISTEGYTSTTGWQTFSDGLKIKMLLSRLTDTMYQIDFDLSISKYDDTGNTVAGVLPEINRTALTQSGVIVPAGQPVLLGSLATRERRRGVGFISARSENNTDSILVWVRVRELDLKDKKIFESGVDKYEIL